MSPVQQFALLFSQRIALVQLRNCCLAEVGHHAVKLAYSPQRYTHCHQSRPDMEVPVHLTLHEALCMLLAVLRWMPAADTSYWYCIIDHVRKIQSTLDICCQGMHIMGQLSHKSSSVCQP